MSEENLNDMVKRTSITRSVPSFDNFNGYFLPSAYKDIENDIRNFEVRDSDIWVNTFPKSGTTWTQEMVWMIANDLDFTGGKETLESRFPLIELAVFGVRNYPELNIPDYFTDSVNYCSNSKKNPRFIKCHLPWTLLPKSIQSFEKRPKIIYVSRNPKDVCVSFYHHHTLYHEFNGTFDDFAKMFLANKIKYTPYWQHITDYWNVSNEENILFLTYEEMKRNLKPVIEKTANFLNKSLTEEQIKKLSSHLSFHSMKKNPSVNKEKYIQHQNGHFIRKGIIGDYKNVMQMDLVKKFDNWIEKNNVIGVNF